MSQKKPQKIIAELVLILHRDKLSIHAELI